MKRKLWLQINLITLLAIALLFVMPNFTLANSNQGMTSEVSIQFIIIDNGGGGGDTGTGNDSGGSGGSGGNNLGGTTEDDSNQNRLPQTGMEVASWSALGGILIVIGIIVAKMKGKDHSI